MIIIGIILEICAATIGTVSKQIIAASKHYDKQWMVILGMGLNMVVGPVVDASAYAFAPQVIIAPLACLDVILNAVTAPYTLHWQEEKLTRHHIIGTALVAIGASFTSVFANADNVVRSVTELEAQLLRPMSVGYLSVELMAICFIQVALRRKLLSPMFRGIAFGAVAGILMGNVFFLKGLIGIIQTSVGSGDYHAWLRPTPYLMIVAAVGGAVLGNVFMTKGLGEYKGVFMVTIFEGSHITAACLSGCMVMEEMAGAPWHQYLKYWFSVFLIIAGMLSVNLAAAESHIEPKQVDHKVLEEEDELNIDEFDEATLSNEKDLDVLSFNEDFGDATVIGHQYGN